MDLIRYSKSQIRSSQKLSDEFNIKFKEKFGRDAKFCCSFSDYNKLFNFENKTMNTDKYEVSYKLNQVLSYKKNNRVTRSKVKDASDKFFEDFIKFRDDKKFPKADEKVKLKEVETKKEEKPKEKPKKEKKSSEKKSDVKENKDE